MEEMLEEVFKKFNINLKDFHDNESLRNMGFDSLKIMELVLEIEEKFDIEIPDEEINGENFSKLISLKELLARLNYSGR